MVLGSTGNVYTVHIGKLPSCTCPDNRHKDHLCKHILFVLLKVMGVDPNSPLIYQAALLENELKEMFECMANRRVGGMDARVLANEQVRSTYAASLKQTDDDVSTSTSGVQRRTLEQDADCPICFDTMAEGELTFCRVTCGTNFHEDCIRRWLGQHRTNPTCPNCRQPWLSHDDSTSSPKKEGYTNLGQMQGLPSERDTVLTVVGRRIPMDTSEGEGSNFHLLSSGSQRVKFIKKNQQYFACYKFVIVSTLLEFDSS